MTRASKTTSFPEMFSAATDVADGVDVGHVGAHPRVDRDGPPVVHTTPAFSAPSVLPLGVRPTATSTLSNTSSVGALGPSKLMCSPSGAARTPLTRVPR